MPTRRVALVIFVRAPVAGEVKTRLLPALGEEGAAELYRCFLLDTLAGAAALQTEVIVAAAEETQVAAVRALVEGVCPGAQVVAQAGRDLGERMRNAFGGALDAGYQRVVIIGSDAPTLPWDRVRQALAAEQDLTLGPCHDGGYYLIGMRAAVPQLFAGIVWGGPTVLVETLRCAEQLRLTVSLLEPWYDVDTPQDLERLCADLTAMELAGQEIPCPRTWQWLQAQPPPRRG